MFLTSQGNAADRSPNFHQPITPLPMRAQMGHSARNFLAGNLRAGARRDFCRLLLCNLQKLAIAQQVSNPQSGHAGLSSAKKFSRAAKLQVEFGNFESIGGAYHGVE